MAESPHTMLAVYIIWHPNYSKGSKIAESIRGHFRNGRYKNVLGDIGLSVVFRSSPVPDAETPLAIDLDDAETTAIIVLAESVLAGDSAWRKYVDELINDAEAYHYAAFVPNFSSLYPFRYTPTLHIPSSSLNHRCGTIFAYLLRVPSATQGMAHGRI